MDYKEKLITVEEALALVKSDDIIVSGLAAAEGRAFFEQLHTIADKVNNVKVVNCLPMLQAKYFTEEQYLKSFYIDSWFYTGPLEKDKSQVRYLIYQIISICQVLKDLPMKSQLFILEMHLCLINTGMYLWL